MGEPLTLWDLLAALGLGCALGAWTVLRLFRKDIDCLRRRLDYAQTCLGRALPIDLPDDHESSHGATLPWPVKSVSRNRGGGIRAEEGLP